MTKTNNEVQASNEIVLAESRIVRENENFVVVQGTDGKFKRSAKYTEYSSVKVETRQDKIWLMNLLDGAENSGTGLKDAVGSTIEVQDIIFNPYDKVDEETGELSYGVLTYLITPDKQVFVTSSKSVYFTVKRITELFGLPSEPTWENVLLKVGKEKGLNGDLIKVKMVG